MTEALVDLLLLPGPKPVWCFVCVCVFSIFKVFIDFVAILLLFYVLVFWPRGMWDPSSLNRD